jgi:PBSX family phage terminase large subunit
MQAEAATRAVQRVQSAKREAARGYEPHGAIAKLFASTADELILSGPAGTGKTRANLEVLHQIALKYPRSRQLIGRKTRRSLTETALVTYERDVLGFDNPICQNVKREQRHVYRYPNGSEIVVGGLDKASKTLSAEYDTIYINEVTELTLADWETLLRALRSGVVPTQRLLGDCNPDRADHWILKRAKDGQLTLVKTTHEDNPILWDAATGMWTERGTKYIQKLDKLTGVRKQRLRWGEWVTAEGAIYAEHNPAVHVKDSFDIPAEWRRIRAIDFGYTNPFVCQWWAINPDGDMYLYREIYMTQRTVKVHAEQINRLSVGERYEANIADHDAEDRATLAESGIRTSAAVKDVSPGIQKVQERLKIDEKTEKPRLYFFRDALVELDETLEESGLPTSTIDEIGGYEWAKTPDGKPKKDEPKKENDHGMDPMRYAVVYVDGLGNRTGKVTRNPFYGGG